MNFSLNNFRMILSLTAIMVYVQIYIQSGHYFLVVLIVGTDYHCLFVLIVEVHSIIVILWCAEKNDDK